MKRQIDDVAAEPEPESDDDSDDESESEAEDTGPPRCSCGALSKYRCPGCGERSCSLACVKRHKAEKPCDGRRDPAAYFALGDGTDELLLRDYHFLEQAGKTVDGAGRALRQSGVAKSAGARPPQQPPHRRKLLQQAERRGVALELLPVGMQRQRENTSSFEQRAQQLRWRVELHFAQAQVRHVEASVPERTVLRALLDALLLPAAAAAGSGPERGRRRRRAGRRAGRRSIRRRRRATALLRHKLRLYARAGMGELGVFLRVPHTRADEPRYSRLSLDATLGEALRGERLIEFPTLHVATPEEAGAFTLVERPAPVVAAADAAAADGGGPPPLQPVPPLNRRSSRRRRRARAVGRARAKAGRARAARARARAAKAVARVARAASRRRSRRARRLLCRRCLPARSRCSLGRRRCLPAPIPCSLGRRRCRRPCSRPATRPPMPPPMPPPGYSYPPAYPPQPQPPGYPPPPGYGYYGPR